jgi:hypothetical protein
MVHAAPGDAGQANAAAAGGGGKLLSILHLLATLYVMFVDCIFIDKLYF